MLSKILNKYCKDSTFTKLWNNKKFSSSIKLLLWAFFMILICLAVVLPSQNQSTTHLENQNVIVTFADMKTSLLRENFDYKYTLESNNEKTIYHGTSNGKQKLIYVEDASGLKEYFQDENNIYLVSMGLLNETDYRLPECFNLESVFNSISQIEPDIDGDNFIFANSDIYVKIIANDDEISNIVIVKENESILLEFLNINQITSIDY